VLRLTVVCVVFAGCGFRSAATGGVGNEGPPDAVVEPDAPGGGSGGGSSGETGCFAYWFDGTLKLATPQPLAQQSSSSADERDPWISPDGLTLYYVFQPKGGQASDADIFVATRAAITQPFRTGSGVTNLNTLKNESRASLTEDGKALVLASDRGPVSGRFDLYYSTRNSVSDSFGTGDGRHVAAINASGDQRFDPFLSRDGTRLYLAPFTAGRQHIAVASRASVDADFAAPTPLPIVNSAADFDADPALSADERILVFSSTRSAGVPGLRSTNLWYATRASATAQFTAPKLIPNVNSDDLDGDPMLSADGCTLYFASHQGGGNSYNLFSAEVGTLPAASAR
jgi:Tol biopolymer transport system component